MSAPPPPGDPRAPAPDPPGGGGGTGDAGAFDGRRYQSRFDALAARGVDIHGEAELVRSFRPASALDAGCGTGRVAIELARHGIAVVGVDVDRSMLAEARRRAPELTWVEADLAALDLPDRFDAVVLAGNVPLFCPAERRPALVASCARHVAADGVLIAGFQLGRGFTMEDYETGCAAAGLALAARWSTWDRRPYMADDDYAVMVHRRPGRTAPPISAATRGG